MEEISIRAREKEREKKERIFEIPSAKRDANRQTHGKYADSSPVEKKARRKRENDKKSAPGGAIIDVYVFFFSNAKSLILL